MDDKSIPLTIYSQPLINPITNIIQRVKYLPDDKFMVKLW